jgi:adenosylhomocysteine nucleosidase
VKDAAQRPKSQAGITLVCFALEDEARAFRKLMAGRAGVSILVTGIGRKNAEHSVRGFLQNNSPRRVFTCGFAGGLDPELKVGDVMFQTADAMLAATLRQHGGRAASFHCAARVATTVAEKSRLQRTTGADAVEMESAVIHAVCVGLGIPCMTVRVISDTATEDLPLDFNQLANPDQSLNFGKLAWAIAKSPGKIPALLRLQKHTSFAAKRLAEALARVT